MDYIDIELLQNTNIKNYFIAYFDILGSVNDDDKEREILLINAINASNDLLKRIIELFKKSEENINIEMKIFSDNFFFCTEKDYIALLELIGCMQSALISFDIFIRGSLCYGELIYNKDFIFGKGLNKAYKIESEIAIFPRIILDNSLFTGIEKIENKKKQIEEYYCIDNDNNKYLDYLNIMKKYKEYEAENSKYIFNVLLENHVKYIKKNIGSNNMRIEQKYQWCKQYHNHFCIDYCYQDYLINEN